MCFPAGAQLHLLQEIDSDGRTTGAADERAPVAAGGPIEEAFGAKLFPPGVPERRFCHYKKITEFAGAGSRFSFYSQVLQDAPTPGGRHESPNRSADALGGLKVICGVRLH
jgi:hypothetical protein